MYIHIYMCICIHIYAAPRTQAVRAAEPAGPSIVSGPRSRYHTCSAYCLAPGLGLALIPVSLLYMYNVICNSYYTCVYMYIYIYICVYIYVYICINIYMCMFRKE